MNGMHLHRIGKMSLGVAAAGSEVVFEFWRAIDVNALHIASQPSTGKQSHQSENMVTVHMGDKNSRYLANPQIAAENLVLGTFSTVK